MGCHAEQVLEHLLPAAEMVHLSAGVSGADLLSQSHSAGAWCLRTADYHCS